MTQSIASHRNIFLSSSGGILIGTGAAVVGTGGVLLLAAFFPESFLGVVGNFYNLYTGPSIIVIGFMVKGVGIALIFIALKRKKASPPKEKKIEVTVREKPALAIVKEQEVENSSCDESGEKSNSGSRRSSFSGEAESNEEEKIPKDPFGFTLQVEEIELSSDDEKAALAPEREEELINQWFVDWDSEEELTSPQVQPEVAALPSSVSILEAFEKEDETPSVEQALPQDERKVEEIQPLVKAEEVKVEEVQSTFTPLPAVEQMAIVIEKEVPAITEKEEIPVIEEEERVFPRKSFKRAIATLAILPKTVKERRNPSRDLLMEQFHCNEKTKLTPAAQKFVEKLRNDFHHLIFSPEFRWLIDIKSKNQLIKKRIEEKKKNVIATQSFNWRSELNKKVTSDLHAKLLVAFEKFYFSSEAVYPAEAIKELLNKIYSKRSEKGPVGIFYKSIALFGLMPFFLHFYKNAGDERQEVLDWVDQQFTDLLDMVVTELGKDYKELSSLLPLIEFIRSDCFKGARVLNAFLGEEDFPGKMVVRNGIFHLFEFVCSTAAMSLKEEADKLKKITEGIETAKSEIVEMETHLEKYKKEESEKKFGKTELSVIDAFARSLELYKKKIDERIKDKNTYFVLFKTFVYEVIPMTRDVLLSVYGDEQISMKKGRIERYLSKLSSIEESASRDFTDFSLAIKMEEEKGESEKEKPLALKPIQTTDLIGFGESIDKISGEIKEILLGTKKRAPDLYKTSKKKKKYARLQTESETIVSESFQYITSILGKGVESPGALFVKTTLLTQAVLAAYPESRDREALFDAVCNYFISHLKQAHVETQGMQEAIDALKKAFFKQLESKDEMSPYLNKGFEYIPFHLLPPLFLIAVFGMKHFTKLRPFLATHVPLLFDSLEALPEKERKMWAKEVTAFKLGLEAFISMLSIPNKLLGQRIPGKEWAISLGINSFRKVMKSHLKKHLNLIADDNQMEYILNLAVPFIHFLAAGVFARGVFGTGYAEGALDAMEKDMQIFTQAIYNFDTEEAADDPSILEEHVRKTFKLLIPQEIK